MTDPAQTPRKSQPEGRAAEGADGPQYASTTPWIVFLRRHIWAVAIIFGIVMITALRNPLIRRPELPEPIAQLVDARLVDQDGREFSLASMRGKVWVVGFVFTRCPTSCPRVSQSMVELARDIETSKIADHVGLLSVSVDPEFDTPAVLKAYADELGADTERWSFVTGTTPEITRFVVDGFKTAIGERREISPGVFDIAHSSRLALVDATGVVRGYFSADAEWAEDRHRLYHALFPVIRAGTDP